MERYIIKSQQVFTGLMDKPQPAMVLVNGSEIEAVLPEEADLDRYGNIPVKDYGDSLNSRIDTQRTVMRRASAFSRRRP